MAGPERQLHFSWRADKVITIRAEPAEADALPPALKPFGAVLPLVTDINLSRGRRVHQVRLGGGDASSDSYCYPS